MQVRDLLPLVCVLALPACAVSVSFEEYETRPQTVAERSPVVVRGVVPGAWVVFHDGDGNLLEAAQAPPSGVVTSKRGPTLVTVEVAQVGRDRELVTYGAITPGTEIEARGSSTAQTDETIVSASVRALAGAQLYGLEAFGQRPSWPVASNRNERDMPPVLTASVPASLRAADGTVTLLGSARFDDVRTDVGAFRCAVERKAVAGSAIEINAPWETAREILLEVQPPKGVPSRSEVDIDVDLEAVVAERRGQAACTAVLTPPHDGSITATLVRRRLFVLPSLERDIVARAAFAWRSPDSEVPWQRYGVIVHRRGPLTVSGERLDATGASIRAALDIVGSSRPRLRWEGAEPNAWVITVRAPVSASVPGIVTSWRFVEAGVTRERARPELPPELAARTPLWTSETIQYRVESVSATFGNDVARVRAYSDVRGDEAPPPGTVRVAWLEFP